MASEETSARAVDPRPARTRAAIYAAVNHLAQQPGEDISVNALVRIAGVSRQSFYNQFTGLGDLAVQMVADLLHKIEQEDESLPPTVSPRERTEHALRRSVEHFYTNRTFYRALLDWNIGSEVVPAIVQANVELACQMIRECPGLPPDCNVDDLALYSTAGGMSLLIAGLREEEPAPAEAMIQRLLALYPPWMVWEAPGEADRRVGPGR